MSLLMEAYIPGLQANGFITGLNATFNGDLTVLGTTTIAGVTLTDLTVTGNTAIGNAVTDTLTVQGATSIKTTAAAGLVVGANGATTPAFTVDASTASQVTGLKVVGAATGGTVAVAVTQTSGNANLTIDAIGSGTITLNGTATGAVTITPATTITGLITSTGGLTTPAGVITKSSVAVPATAGAIAAGPLIKGFSTPISIWVTSDAPTHSAFKGDLCINTGGSSSSTRLYINNGTTTWIAVTTAS